MFIFEDRYCLLDLIIYCIIACLIGIGISNWAFRYKLTEDGTYHWVVNSKTGETNFVPIRGQK